MFVRNRRNRRTLAKRIRKAISLSAFVTVVFLSSLISCLIMALSKEFAVYEAEAVCRKIQNEFNLSTANNTFFINPITELRKDNYFIRLWVNDRIKESILYHFDPFREIKTKIFVQLEINKTVIYSNDEKSTGVFADFYDGTEAVMPIFDSEHKYEIGKISVRVNPDVIIPIVGMILLTILILSILALIIAKVLSMFLTIPVIYPMRQLEKKVKALAEGDHETALNTQLVLKRPLKEIESFTVSTNEIMKKLHGYTEILENQKEALENQNTELEMQNDELFKSKQQIEEQQAQLIQSEKMASVGLLTAAITHEINTPVGAINSNSQLTQMLLSSLADNTIMNEEEELQTIFVQLNELNDVNLMACSRIIEIIKSLKSFSRLDQAEFQEADINEGIKSVLVLTNNLLKRRVTVHEDYGDIPLVKCFPGQLNQVFMNIIVNASQAIEGEGDLFIKTYQDGRYLFINIKDTGVGIEPENIAKIFEPGFTTKGVGIGLGIGLYLSYSIIHNHKGEITVASEPGKGTEFRIKLPIDNERT